MIPRHGHEPGIYFDMPDDIYHDDPAIGSTDLRHLKESAADFHWQWSGNPDRDPEVRTDALKFGDAVHKYVLEGEAVFNSRFILRPEGPGVLKTQEDMKEWLAARSMDTKGTKPVLAKRIAAMDKRAVIADAVIQAAEANGQTVLSFDQWRRVKLAVAYITKNPELQSSFEGGRKEVAIFWQRRGIRMKARIDCLQVYWHPEYKVYEILNADLKSFSNPQAREVEEAIDAALGRYLQQEAHYRDGIRHLRGLIHDGLVYGDVDPDYLALLTKAKRILSAFIFYKSSGAPFAQGRFISTGNSLSEDAGRLNETCLDTFEKYYNTFGEKGPWVSLLPPRELNPDDLPHWMRP